MMLYKYYAPPPTSKHSIDNIKNETICFSEMDSFNDPFEGVGQFLYEITEEERKYWDSIGSSLPAAFADHVREESRESVKFYNRVFCITGKYNNPLMWAHYADSHRGFCVGYESEDIKKVCTRFEAITYCSVPPIVSVDNLDNLKIKDLLYCKSDSWSYEEEWRAVYMLQDEDVEHLDYSSNFSRCFATPNNTDKLYIPYGRAIFHNLEVLSAKKHILKSCAPKAIYLGIRTNSDLRSQLIDICREKSIPAFQMAKVDDSFNMREHRII